MSKYELELEHLILETLLPVYEKWQKSKGVVDVHVGINESILKKIKAKKNLPALLRPKETQT